MGIIFFSLDNSNRIKFLMIFKEGVKSDVSRNRVLGMQVLNALADDPSADDIIAPQLKDWLLLCR